MSILDIFKRKTRIVRFEKDPPGEWITLETPDGVLDSFSYEDISACIRRLLKDPDYFLILTLPEAVNGVRYVQACECRGDIEVQAAVEKKDHVRLVRKCCTESECIDIFNRFFDAGIVDNLRKYRPVRFLRQQDQTIYKETT